ncbi:MAG: DUF2059 domain-containing protein [Caulobacteraceae bacterium]
MAKLAPVAAFVSSGFLLLGCPALSATDQPHAPSSTAPQTINSPPNEQVPSAARLALARGVVEALGVSDQWIQGFRRAFGREQQARSAGTKPSKDSAMDQELAKYSEARAETYVPQMKEKLELWYAANFTDNELSQMKAFYESETGKLFLQFLPQVENELSMRFPNLGSSGTLSQADANQMIKAETDAYRELLRTHFTDVQIQDIALFQRTDGGRAIGRKQDAVKAQALTLTQWLLARVLHDRMEKWCDLAHCTPRMRSWIDHPELMNAQGPTGSH